MPKTDNGGTATWRKNDAAYRAQARKRRKANATRRAEVAAAAAAGRDVQAWRKLQKEESK